MTQTSAEAKQGKPFASKRSEPPIARRSPSYALRIAGAALVVLLATLIAWRLTHPGGEPADTERPAVTGAAEDPTETRLRDEATRAPTNPRPHRELGDHLLGRGRAFSALWEYQEALAREPNAADTKLALARAAAEAGYLPLAERTLRELLQSSGRVEAARALADVLLRSAKPVELVAVLKPLRTEHPELDRDLGRAYRVLGQFPAAEAAYLRLRKADPLDQDALLGLAQLYLEWNRPAATIRLLSDASRQGLLDARGWLWLGRAYAQRVPPAKRAVNPSPDDLDQAAACVMKVMELQPRDPAPYLEAGLLLEQKADLSAAADQFAQAARLDPTLPEARLALARVLRAIGLKRRARHELAVYYRLRRQPDRIVASLSADGASPIEEPETAREAILALTALQQSKRAAALSDAALRRHPDAQDLRYQAMLIHLQAGSRARLEAMCRQVEQQFPQSGVPEWFRGRLALADARTADAVRHFEAAAAREPKRADYHAALGDALSRVPTPENLSRAIPALETALSLNPDDAATRRQLAELVLRATTNDQRPATNDRQEPGARSQEPALAHLLLALDRDPSLVPALNNLVQIAGTTGRPAHAALLSEVARILEARSRALEPLRRAVRDRPADRAAWIALARALARHGRLQEARDHWERAAEGNAPPDVKAAFAASERLIAVLRG